MNETRTEFEAKLDSTHNDNEELVKKTNDEHEEELKKKIAEIEEFQAKCTELEASIEDYKQKVKDVTEDKKLHEKKGLSIVSGN